MLISRAVATPLDGAPGVDLLPVAPGLDTERVRVDLLHLAPGASLPRHPAGRAQSFLVIDGEGEVAGDDDVRVPVHPGDLVTWEIGEQHTSWASTAMTVLIVQRAPAR